MKTHEAFLFFINWEANVTPSIMAGQLAVSTPNTQPGIKPQLVFISLFWQITVYICVWADVLDRAKLAVSRLLSLR